MWGPAAAPCSGDRDVSSMSERLFARERRPTYVAAFVVAILLAFVVQQSWAGRPITWDSILFTLVVGVTIGSIYAIFAIGPRRHLHHVGHLQLRPGRDGHVLRLHLLGAEGRQRGPDARGVR